MFGHTVIQFMDEYTKLVQIVEAAETLIAEKSGSKLTAAEQLLKNALESLGKN
jgi:hypothetical protein